MEEIGGGMRTLFEPRGVAVIGASRERTKIGYKILSNILAGGYRGRIWPVNPSGGEILGLPSLGGLAEADGPIDLAVVAIPAPRVEAALVECAERRVANVCVITSGFSETGNAAGERRLVAIARESGMRLLGPNIFGIWSAAADLNATFGPGSIPPGNVAIVTQSGALGLAMIGKCAVDGVGLSAIISVGNKADIDEADLLEYLVAQQRTRVILMYIEGVRDGRRLVAALRRSAGVKPVVTIKSGRSRRGAVAAASHTGSLSGADEVFDDVMRQCGVLRAEDVPEAFDWCRFLAGTPPPDTTGTVIVTNGGGIGVLATDACEKHQVPLHDDTARLAGVFGPAVPAFGSTRNPIDLTGQASSSHYNFALEAALEDRTIGQVIALYCETAVFDAENLVEMVRRNADSYRADGKPLVFALFGGEITENATAQLRRQRVPVFTGVYDAVGCLGALDRFLAVRCSPPGRPAGAEIDVETIETVTRTALAEGRTFLLAPEAARVMRAAGIRMPESRLARTVDEAVRQARLIGFPVVLKIVSRDIVHKSDVGGVALDLDDEAEVIDAFQAVMQSCRDRAPGAAIEGIEVAEMVGRGVELIIGARQDRAFGPLVMVGQGGIYVEVMKDVAFRAVPLSRSEAAGMVKQLRAYPLLLGVRGEERREIEAVEEMVIRLAAIVDRCPLVTDIEINPLVVYEQGSGVRAVDARILLSKPEQGESA